MTNESDRINPEIDCLDCGKCCESFEIAYPNPKKLSECTDEILVWRSEMNRFQMLREIGDKITRREDFQTTWLIFQFPCKYLLSNKTCEIYDSPLRPLLCRRFPHSNTTKESCPKVRV